MRASPRTPAFPEEVAGWISQELFEQVPVSISVIDRDMNIVLANQNFSAVFGQLSGHRCYEAYKKRQAPCELCPVQKTFSDGQYRVTEGNGVDCIGKHAHYVVHHVPLPCRKGDIAYVVNMSQDITDRKSLQTEYNFIFEQVPCSLVVINKDLRIVRANRHARGKYGQALGSYCYRIYKGRGEPCEDCPAQKTFLDGLLHASHQIRVRPNGEKTYHTMFTAPLTQGEMDHIIEMSLDVTDLHLLSEQILEKERLAAVGQTVVQVAHSIKNILTGLQAGLYEIRAGQHRASPERTTDGIEILDRNFQRINDLVQTFLTFSREVEAQLSWVEPRELVEEVYQLFLKRAEQGGIALRCEARELPDRVLLDPKGIHVCLSNLVANAIEACEEVDRESHRVEIRSWLRGDRIVFEVQDTGCGMDEEMCRRLFSNVFTTKGKKGTGLGLVMSRRIVEDHGGSIGVISAIGDGSTFQIELPREGPVRGETAP